VPEHAKQHRVPNEAAESGSLLRSEVATSCVAGFTSFHFFEGRLNVWVADPAGLRL